MASAGVCWKCETVATITQSTWRASTPERSSACSAAATAIDRTVSSSVAQRRSLMPERCWTHSSLESMRPTISLLGTTREGR